MTSKKKLVLHIGSHKTATTHIQGVLAKNKRHLTAMSVLYPRAGQIYDAHFRLCWALRDPDLAETGLTDIDEWAALVEEIRSDPAERAIVSAEEFGLHVDPARLAPLRDIFDVTVVSYLRSPDGYMQSFYNQFVKDFANRETRTLTTYLAEENLHFLNTRFLLEPWCEVFGADAIRLRLFDQAIRGPGGIVRDFFTAIGCTALPEFEDPGISVLHKVSLPPDALEYLRFANPYLTRQEGHHPFVIELVRLGRMHKDQLGATRAGILSMKSRQALRRRFAAQNAWAARRFLDADRTPFTPNDAVPPPPDFDRRPEEADGAVLGRVAALLHDHQITRES